MHMAAVGLFTGFSPGGSPTVREPGDLFHAREHGNRRR